MLSYNFIARQIRDKGFQSCTATVLFHLGFLQKNNIDDHGFIRARLYKPAGKSLTFNGFGMEGTLKFLRVQYSILNDDPTNAKTGQYLLYSVYDLYNALTYVTGVDIPEMFLKQQSSRETAMELKGMRDAHYAEQAAMVEPDKLFHDDLVAADDAKDRTEKRPLWGEALVRLMMRRGYEWKPEVIPFWTMFKLVRRACEEKFKP
jgi:hypothetical protein